MSNHLLTLYAEREAKFIINIDDIRETLVAWSNYQSLDDIDNVVTEIINNIISDQESRQAMETWKENDDPIFIYLENDSVSNVINKELEDTDYMTINLDCITDNWTCPLCQEKLDLIDKESPIIYYCNSCNIDWNGYTNQEVVEAYYRMTEALND